MNEPLLTAEKLREAFTLLGSRLQTRGVTADVFIFGGAAMVLGFDARPSTRDVNAIWRPHGVVQHEAWEVASILDLPRWWLNEQASSYLPAGTNFDGSPLFDVPGLRVIQASPELLLAMKIAAARTGDLDDIRLLADHLKMNDATTLIAHAERVLGEPISDRKRMIIEDLFPNST
jgi:Nucleotidyltransferase of unknown function (DUF6036)